jgi:hypothetical protein
MLMPVLAAGALLLAGCGEEDGTTPGGQADLSAEREDDESAASEDPDDGEPDDGEPDTSRAPDGAGGDPLSGTFVARAEEIAHAWPDRLEPWERKIDGGLLVVQGLAETSPQDTTLVVAVGHGNCDADWGSWVHETDELVIVGGWSAMDPEAGACEAIMDIDDVEVALEAPLGDRTVLDASTAMDPRAEDYEPYS